MRSTLVRSSNYKWWAFIALAVGTFITVVDHGTIIVAMPTIATYFQTDLPTVQWLVVGYSLTVSALLLPMGRLSDIVGRKQVYIAGLAIFVIGAAAAGLSPNVITLILSKILQGCGTAMTQGTGMAMITSVFPSSERGKALGTHMSVVGSGAIAGPALGGLLVSLLNWRWVFFISVPAGALAIAAALIVLDKTRLLQQQQSSRFDWLGAALSAGVLITLLMGMTTGSRTGWTSIPIVLTMLSFVALAGAFIWWELRAPDPMLDLRLFKSSIFSLGVSARFISFLGMSSSRFLMPFYLQSVLGFGVGQVGLILVPSAAVMIVMGPISGYLSDRYQWQRLVVAGLALSALGLFLLSRVTDTSSLALPLAGMILQSFGLGIFNSPNASSIFGAVDQSRYGVVSALNHLTRNSASVISIAVATAIVTATMASMGHPPNLGAITDGSGEGIFSAFTSGMRTAYLAMGGLLILGIAISILVGSQPKGMASRSKVEPQAGGSPLD